MAKKMKVQFQTFTTNLVGMVRNATLEGRDYLVVPMVMLVEGVLNGSNGSLYYPAEELAKVPQVWNHKPVVVYHPQMNGKALSACDPEILESHKVGIILNTTFDGKRLKAEAWLEPSRLAVVDNRIQTALDNGSMMEVSTGLFTENEEVSGNFNGEDYTSIARNYRPDHLAILPDQIGACSIADGAGLLRTNAARQTGEYQRLLDRLNVNADASHDEIRSAIYNALESLRKKAGDIFCELWIEEVYDEWFVYMCDRDYFKQNYKVNEDKTVQLEGLPVEVKRVVTYESVQITSNQKKGDKDMDKKAIVETLIANGKWAEEDREFLLGLNEDQLAKMTPVENTEIVKDEEPKIVEEKTEETPVIEKIEDAPAVNTEAVSADQYLANAPADIREVLNEALTTQAQRRAELIDAITANKKNILTKEQLSALSMNGLSAMAALANEDVKDSTSRPPNFSGMAPVGNAGDAPAEEEPLEAPTMNFDNE